jgi:LPS O-antigen subunit length determinant protein (WzzB/FepE family)
MPLNRIEVSELLDQCIAALGEILAGYVELNESLLDQTTRVETQRKVDVLKARLADEKLKLQKHRNAQQRKHELERIRSAHEREREKQAHKPTQSEGKSAPNMVALRNQKGEVIGWAHVVGKNQIDFLNSKGRLIAREILGQTYNGRGNLAAYDRQGLRVLGQQMGAHHPSCHRTSQTR